MYTEEEAKKLWCPEYVGDVKLVCIASGCMMWRWSISPAFAKGNTGLVPEGYCGSAGKPER